MIVMKFGGTSMGTVRAIEQVVDVIIKRRKEVVGVVVSAYSKCTDQLIELGHLASTGDLLYTRLCEDLLKRHLDSVYDLIKNLQQKQKTAERVIETFEELKRLLEGIFLIRELSPRTLDLLMSFGERLSAYILAQTLVDRGLEAEFVDTRKFIKTDRQFGNAKVNFQVTDKKIRNFFRRSVKLPILTGFIASSADNETTTLGRGGSDYTAAILGAALCVDSIEIWTDVDGVMTADPKKVKRAFPIINMSYEEAMEMSHFGAKVIYFPTMTPAKGKQIPIMIRNTFNQSFRGTKIGVISARQYIICGISSISDVVIMLFQGSSMVGMPGIASRLFDTLARENINIILITQSSSEHTICLAISSKDVRSGVSSIEAEFKQEMADKTIDPVIIRDSVVILSVVGDNMRHTPGVAGMIFGALGQCNISVSVIAQGSSERNISFVLDRKDEEKALDVIHKKFFGSKKNEEA